MRRVPLPLALVLLIGVGAPLLSTLLFFARPPQEGTNFGELVGPAPIPRRLVAADGTEVGAEELAGKWLIVQVSDAACAGEDCRRKLCLARFLSLSRPEAGRRSLRVFLARGDADPPAEVLAPADCGAGFGELARGRGPVDVMRGVRVLRMDRALDEWVRAAGPGDPEDHLYLADPAGNLMMRYEKGRDPYKIAKDFKRLLRLSRTI